MSQSQYILQSGPSAPGPHAVIERAASAPGPHVVMEANPDGIANRIASALSLLPEREAGA